MQKTTLSLALLTTISLNASSVNLEPITITTASKTSQSLQSTTANVNILTAQMMQERGFHTVSDALKSIAGFSVNRNGGLGTTTSVQLRGFSTNRVLVLVDGVRYNDTTSTSGAAFSHLLVSNIERIEVIKGAQSGIWGADASAGVINIITKKTANKNLSGSLFAEYGSYNTLNYGFKLSKQLNCFDIALSANRLTSDGFSAQVDDNKSKSLSDFEDDGYENTSFNIRAGFDITDYDRVEAFYSLIDADTEFDGYKAPNDNNTSIESKQQFYGLSYKRTADWGDATLYANHSGFERYQANGFTKNFDGSIDEIGANAKYAYHDNSFVTIGLDHKTFEHENAISKSTKNDGIFIANTHSFIGLIAGETILSSALRYDKFDNFDNKFTYKVGVKHIHENIKDFWTSLNYATAYNVPSLFHLYSSYGNVNINPEETQGFDVTANFKGFGVTYFNNTIKEMIDYDFTTSKYGNIAGESKLSGVEFSFDTAVEAINTNFAFNYTYLKTEDKDGKALLRRPENAANIMIDYYGFENTHLGTHIQYVGDRDERGDKTMDAYTLVNLSGSYDIGTELNLYAKIHNLLDEEYQEISGYATSERAFTFGVRYKLN